MFDYGQKKFVNLEAEDDIADKYEKKYPDYVHEPALYDYGMKGFFGTKTNKRYSTPEATLQNDRYNSIMKVEKIAMKYNKLAKSRIKKWNLKPIKSILSHQELLVTFWLINMDKKVLKKFNYYRLKKYPMPVVLDNFINKFFNIKS